MDSRLVLSVIFVTLGLGFMGTYAQSNTTTVSTLVAGNTTLTGNNTGTSNTTSNTVAATTVAPPVSPNITVVALETPVSNAQCGKQQLCASEPPNCNPSIPGSCFLIGAQSKGGANFEFALAGQSSGYIAASVSTGSTQGPNDPNYVCANNNGVVRFFSTVLVNGQLQVANLSVTSVKGSVNGSQIQCTFVATFPDPLLSATRATAAALSVSTGSFNATSGALGAPTPVIRTAPVDLTNPNTTVANVVNTTTGNNPIFTLFAGNLSAPISRTGCSSSKLCVAEPSVCDPSTANSCFFFSASSKGNQTFNFELSGQSTGYVAAALSTSTSATEVKTFFVCANLNGSVLFVSGTPNITNNQLSFVPLNVSSVNGSVSNGKIQCVFQTTVPDTATRAAGYSVAVANGSFNANSLVAGLPSLRILTNVLDLTNPAATVLNLLSSTNITNGYAVVHQQSLLPALMFTLAVLLFTMQGGK